ncbi:MAG TPA: efflux RND transporter periplasmic adaptor subunit [Candidatus Omnitrophota bacterium]|nr:efflux RND transporter periplasmic adaptor subunit [Candidatus Omnitrophota bacterium]HQL41515.1 efflux RND transporter periplasmic adaptor subunit [Candidatus Omnitrophota bacterium]
MKRTVIIITILIFSVFVVVGFARFYLDKYRSKIEIVDHAIPVQVEKAQTRTMNRSLEYVGNVRAQEEALIYPKVPGKLIEKIKVEGDAVKKGDVLMYIDRDEVGLRFEKAPVESPMDGVVGGISVDLGEHLTTQTAVGLIVKMDQMKIVIDIPEIYATKIFFDQAVHLQFDAYPGDIFNGRITKISPIVNTANRSFPIEILIPNPEDKLKSGMFAKVEIVIEAHQDAIAVRKEAIMGKEPNAYVYVINNDTAQLRGVTLGIRSADLVEVTSGVDPDDAVVIMGQQRLFDGAKVRVDTRSRQEFKL